MSEIWNIPRDWSTPATKYPCITLRTASITRQHMKRGYYRMEGVGGYEAWYNHYRIPLTSLCINDEIVMVDDPLHWRGMQLLAEAAHGNVLIVGLGLGLIHEAIIKQPQVESIEIYEVNPDVIGLVTPLLSRHDKYCTVRHRNGFTAEGDFDTVIVDIAVRGDDGIVRVAGTNEVQSLYEMWVAFKAMFPNEVYVWGLKQPELNPAVVRRPKH